MQSAVSPPPRPDLEASEHAVRLAFPAVVRELSQILGPKLVAYLSGVRETRAVREWEAGARVPRDPIPQRLRLALQVALLIGRHDGPGVVQAWFQGLNPQLDDRSPARMLREGELHEVGPEVLSAARAFTTGG
ncbi:MAG TPA: hypothetical protein VNE71_16260 [Myxococcota bacterium]|nr:hypothetical protein [Myxococcota bacterium]